MAANPYQGTYARRSGLPSVAAAFASQSECGTSATVLIVDDEPGIIEQIATYLECMGHTAYGLRDPRKAAELLQSIDPAVSILAYDIPYTSRLELMDVITDASPNEQMIFLTRDDVNHPVEGAGDRTHQYLPKPVQLPDVGQAVTRAVAESRRAVESAYFEELARLVADEVHALDDTLASQRKIPLASFDVLASALDMRDQSTSGHSKRVAQMTAGIAETIGLTGPALAQIRYGALLHDVGKLKTPAHILLKPGPLSEEEWVIMREHPRHGFDFCSTMSALQGAREIIYSHHEKFDGSGYPRGLRGEEIVLGARIFAVVDAVDAMIFDRPYHKGVAFEEAEREVRKCAGSHFDPGVIEASLAFLRSTFE